jgi:hypothetical protein
VRPVEAYENIIMKTPAALIDVATAPTDQRVPFFFRR